MLRLSAALLFAASALHAADDLDSQMKRIVDAYALVESTPPIP